MPPGIVTSLLPWAAWFKCLAAFSVKMFSLISNLNLLLCDLRHFHLVLLFVTWEKRPAPLGYNLPSGSCRDLPNLLFSWLNTPPAPPHITALLNKSGTQVSTPPFLKVCFKKFNQKVLNKQQTAARDTQKPRQRLQAACQNSAWNAAVSLLLCRLLPLTQHSRVGEKVCACTSQWLHVSIWEKENSGLSHCSTLALETLPVVAAACSWVRRHCSRWLLAKPLWDITHTSPTCPCWCHLTWRSPFFGLENSEEGKKLMFWRLQNWLWGSNPPAPFFFPPLRQAWTKQITQILFAQR